MCIEQKDAQSNILVSTDSHIRVIMLFTTLVQIEVENVDVNVGVLPLQKNASEMLLNKVTCVGTFLFL